ncbi:hypothetical protein SAMN05518672_102521 [Chitinophaga sp. CF118]|uniref:hypothetical protein n=1 Tax=Chitinophaga sp. CF118 TaxID=1884367 RepID=UPI0008E1D8CE|nr:hypothetical protein [Chitinophaga sp. CF118]SFD58956.1 hypothetical protein SAMN05518672_102521 [Chitinophaga sp. CF118]
MKKSFLLFVAAMFSVTLQCMSQDVKKEFKDCSTINVYTALQGDTILIKCDTSFLLNKPTFNLYQKYYKKVKSGSSSVKEILDNYDNIIVMKDSMLTQKEFYYQELKLRFDSLSDNSLTFINKTSDSLHAVSTALDSATNKLVDTQNLLKDSQKLLTQERKKATWKTLKFGIGGVVVGVLVALLLSN